MTKIFVISDDPFHDNETLYAAFTTLDKAEHAATVGWPDAKVTELDLDPEVKPEQTWHFVQLTDQHYGDKNKCAARYERKIPNGATPGEAEAYWGGPEGSKWASEVRRGWGLTPEAAAQDCARRHGTFTIEGETIQAPEPTK